LNAESFFTREQRVEKVLAWMKVSRFVGKLTEHDRSTGSAFEKEWKLNIRLFLAPRAQGTSRFCVCKQSGALSELERAAATIFFPPQPVCQYVGGGVRACAFFTEQIIDIRRREILNCTELTAGKKGKDVKSRPNRDKSISKFPFVGAEKHSETVAGAFLTLSLSLSAGMIPSTPINL
jgi:hypothetical protein